MSDGPVVKAEPHIELRHLRHFDAVAHELHFTRAAERLNLTQQAVSTSIRHLEVQLGVRLFDRTTKGVELTDAGQELLRTAPDIIEHVAETCRRVQRSASGIAQAPRLGHSRYLGTTLLPALFNEVRARHQHLSCAARALPPAELMAAMRREHLDLALLVEPKIERGGPLRSRTLRAEPLVALLGAASPLWARERLTMADLADSAISLVPRHSSPQLHEAVLARCEELGFVPTINDEPLLVDDAWMATQFASSDGIALAPRFVVDHLRNWGVPHRVVEDAPLVRIGLVYNPGNETADTRDLRRNLTEAASALAWTSPLTSVAPVRLLDAAA